MRTPLDRVGRGRPRGRPRTLPRMATPELRYGFGANWKDYAETSLNDARIANAVQSLRDLLALETLRGETFLDIGCGSGLFSLAACRLDAARVISFDFDNDSVRTSQWLGASSRLAIRPKPQLSRS